jgi:hypothetical protein
MVAWDFSLAGGDPPFKVAALGFDFPGVEFRAGLKSKKGPAELRTSGQKTNFVYLAAPFRAD